MLSRGSIAMEKAIKFIPDDNGWKKIKLVFHPSPIISNTKKNEISFYMKNWIIWSFTWAGQNELVVLKYIIFVFFFRFSC